MKPLITLDDGETTVLLVTAAIGSVERVAKLLRDGTAQLRSIKVLSATGAVLYERRSEIDTESVAEVGVEKEFQNAAFADIEDALGA